MFLHYISCLLIIIGAASVAAQLPPPPTIDCFDGTVPIRCDGNYPTPLYKCLTEGSSCCGCWYGPSWGCKECDPSTECRNRTTSTGSVTQECARRGPDPTILGLAIGIPAGLIALCTCCITIAYRGRHVLFGPIRRPIRVPSVRFSFALLPRARLHLALLAHVGKHPELHQDTQELQSAIKAYRFFIMRICRGKQKIWGWDSVPREVAWIWHVHCLNPASYAESCISACGKVIPRTWTGPEPFLTKSGAKPRFYPTIDLVAAVGRQVSFIPKASSWFLANDTTMKALIGQYAMFLSLIGRTKTYGLVPTIGIDIMWHTHMTEPVDYISDTTAACGTMLNHDDNLPESSLQNQFQTTKTLWLTYFSRQYGAAGKSIDQQVKKRIKKFQPGAAFELNSSESDSTSSFDSSEHAKMTPFAPFFVGCAVTPIDDGEMCLDTSEILKQHQTTAANDDNIVGDNNYGREAHYVAACATEIGTKGGSWSDLAATSTTAGENSTGSCAGSTNGSDSGFFTFSSCSGDGGGGSGFSSWGGSSCGGSSGGGFSSCGGSSDRGSSCGGGSSDRGSSCGGSSDRGSSCGGGGSDW